MRASSFLFAICATLAAPLAAAATFTVGADAACTHASVLAAVSAAASNGPALDEIRIATNQAYTNVIAPVASHRLRVRGGYSSCSDSTPSGRTLLRGSTSGVNGTFTTSGSAAGYELTLENLELRDGSGSGRRGGALRIEGNFAVYLRNTLIAGNSAARGGGAYVDGSAGAFLTITDGSSLSNNTAEVSGGGVYCQNNGRVFLLDGLILANTAQDGGSDPVESGNGGGVALYDCSMNQAPSNGFEGVLANTALRHGGGYYLRGGSLLFVDGDANAPAAITDNIAGDTGGGLAINDDLTGGAGSISRAEVSDSWIERNLAPTGAGIGLVAGGEVSMARTLDAGECHNATYCSSLSLNEHPSSGGVCIGGAAYLGQSSVLRLRGTRVEENCEVTSGWAFRVRRDAQLRIDSSVIANNGSGEPFFIEGFTFTGLVEVAWSTVTGHYPSGRISFMSLPTEPGNTGTLRIYGSLLGEPFQQLVAPRGFGSLPPMDLEFDCLVLDTYFTAPLAVIRSLELAPPYGMVSAAGGNYRLASGTALPVDWCDESFAPRLAGDADLVTQVYDSPRANQYGIQDIGAYERAAAALPDVIFANGYE